ncbi:hypothetical protein BS47DRAFT_1079712 [Hydnum rufescens UP504]|uniref:Uncharacterized protein n=1 Tax=Hydnum rufescens UP504 TaxID=1448309 RepID=A0A9P6B8W4_9AGAM|nr:hypothetical protein BS47DRAFT_1079712 [Hydnum rufescens UP504]
MASEQTSPSTLQTRLSHLFDINPDSYVNAHAVPARAMLSILRAFSEEHGVTLIKDEESFVATTNAMPDFEITPTIMIDLILQLTGTLPPSPSTSSTSSTTTSPPLSMQRALSEESEGFSEAASGVSQAQPNALEARQRTGPLESGIPSTWKNRPHRARGRSETGFAAITGTASDSPPLASRKESGHRTLSTPTSPDSSLSPSSGGSLTLGRPPSAASSYLRSPNTSIYDPSYLADSMASPIRSPDFSAEDTSIDYSTDWKFPPPELFPSIKTKTDLSKRKPSPNSSPPPSDMNSDPDSDEDNIHDRDADPTIHSRDRIHSISTTSLVTSPEDRLEALQRANAELAKKLRDASRELEHKLSDHEGEIEEMQTRIEDLRYELAASKREEKELRLKAVSVFCHVTVTNVATMDIYHIYDVQRTTTSQLATLEAEMSKLQRQLNSSRAAYQAMQKQYQEQCAVSEKYRNTLRKKDQELKHAEELANGHQHEITKWRSERELSEATIESLKAELNVAQQAQETLEQQKQANFMLKETIDRLRLDLDEIRTTTTGPGSSGGSSARSTLTKVAMSKKALASLAAELSGNLYDEIDEETTLPDGDQEAGGEAGFETIITTSRKRIGARRKNGVALEEIREYADAYTQHDLTDFVSSAITQTDVEPSRSTSSSSSQTSPQLGRMPKMFDVSSQTDVPVLGDVSADIDDDDDDGDDDTSSSSTLTPIALSPSPSPRKHKSPIVLVGPNDLPPSYAHLEAEERENIEKDYLRRWHPGMTSATVSTVVSPTSSDAVAEVSREAVEEWKNLKRELGFECAAIDRVLLKGNVDRSPRKASTASTPANPSVEAAVLTMTPRLAREYANKVKAAAEAEEDDEEEVALVAKHRSPRRRFYNLYNAAFYPGADGHEAPRRNWSVMLTGMGVWAMVLMTGKLFSRIDGLLFKSLMSTFSCGTANDEI